jgi:hypothetical protein
MFGIKNPINAYVTMDNKVSGAAFEKRWFESVIMVLKRIGNNQYTPVEAHKKLLEVCDGLQWVQENLNEKLGSQHRTMLKNIYSMSIQIINAAIDTKNMAYLAIVVTSIEVVIEPYNKKAA